MQLTVCAVIKPNSTVVLDQDYLCAAQQNLDSRQPQKGNLGMSLFLISSGLIPAACGALRLQICVSDFGVDISRLAARFFIYLTRAFATASAAGLRIAITNIAIPARIIGNDNHCPIDMPNDKSPKKLSGSRVNSARNRKLP